jgi:hypothetical protein
MVNSAESLDPTVNNNRNADMHIKNPSATNKGINMYAHSMSFSPSSRKESKRVKGKKKIRPNIKGSPTSELTSSDLSPYQLSSTCFFVAQYR